MIFLSFQISFTVQLEIFSRFVNRYNKFYFPDAVHILACGNSSAKDDSGVAHNLLCVTFAVSDNAQGKGIQMNCFHHGIKGDMLNPKHSMTVEPAV